MLASFEIIFILIYLFAGIVKNTLHQYLFSLPVLYFCGIAPNIIRRRILQCISKTETSIAYAVLRKRQVHENLRNKPHILYNFLCGSLVGNVFRKYHINTKVNIIVDRSLTGINREVFNEYIGYKALMNKTEMFNPNYLEISHVDSSQEKCIQAVDFVVGAIARNYEREESIFYDIIDKNVDIALDFFKGKIK